MKTNDKIRSLGLKIHQIVYLETRIKTAQNMNEENAYNQILKPLQGYLSKICKDIPGGQEEVVNKIQKMVKERVNS